MKEVFTVIDNGKDKSMRKPISAAERLFAGNIRGAHRAHKGKKYAQD